MNESVAGEALVAGAGGNVIDDSTSGVNGAGAGTRVTALLIHAGQVIGTLGIGHAFGATERRCTLEFREARARGRVVDHATLGVRSAWTWLTWVSPLDWFDWFQQLFIKNFCLKIKTILNKSNF